MRMYCDYETETHSAYAFFSSEEYPVSIKEREDYNLFCNTMGMEALVMGGGKVKTIM